MAEKSLTSSRRLGVLGRPNEERPSLGQNTETFLENGPMPIAKCAECGLSFQALAREIKRGGGKFCSRPCYFKHNRKARDFPIDHFWSKVQKTAACWLWIGKLNGYGYGAVRLADGSTIAAHRFSWEMHNNQIQEGLYVCHHCDNPRCVRPDHLFLGTQDDNIKDAKRKNRTAAGEGHGRHRLSLEQVISIRKERQSGTSLGDISKNYGISKGHASLICNNKLWIRDSSASN